MITLLCIFIILNFITFKFNKKIMRDYTKVRKSLKIRKQTWGSSNDPEHLYVLLAFLLFLNIFCITLLMAGGNLVIGSYMFVLLVTYIILGLMQLYFNFDGIIDNCENISLNKSEFSLNVFWQIVINLVCSVGMFVDNLLQKLGLKMPNPIPSITERISKGSKTFNE